MDEVLNIGLEVSEFELQSFSEKYSWEKYLPPAIG